MIALLTENYWHSSFCVCELGAVWFDDSKAFTPILVPPLDYAQLQAVIHGAESLKLDEPGDLDRLRDQVLGALDMRESAAPTPKWNTKKKEFLARLPTLLKKCPFVGPVARVEFENVKKELTEYVEANEQLEEEKRRLLVHLAELESLKDSKAVAEVRRKHSTTDEHFEELTETVKHALAQLPAVVCEALFYWLRDEPYKPKRDDRDDVQEADENGLLNASSEGVYLNKEHAGVAAAVEALEELQEFIRKAPRGFKHAYETEHKEALILSQRPFWKRNF